MKSKLILLFFLGLFATTHVHATHIVGGEFEMLHVSDSTYQITMNLYFDDINGSPGAIDANAVVYIYSQSDTNLMESLLLERLLETPLVPYTNPECAANSTSVRTRVYRYQNTIKLSKLVYNNPSGYYVIWQRCCRNNTIANIVSPGAAGQVFYLEFPPVTVNNQPFINSSPQLFPPLSDYACVNDDFQFDFSGADTDGDSLVYSMATPLDGNASSASPLPPSGNPAPYDTITWEAGYGLYNSITGDVPLQIHPQTGFLKLKANQTGLFVFAIKCEEYRNGVYIGQVRRDFQLLVKDCLPNNPPSLENIISNGNTYQEGDTITVKAIDNRCFNFTVKDEPIGAVTSQKLTIKVKAINFNPITFPFSLSTTTGTTTAAKDSINSSICFDDCSASYNGGIFIVEITATDNGCSIPKSTTRRLIFRVEKPINSPAVLQSSIASTTNHRSDTATITAGQTLVVTLKGTDLQNDYLQLKSKIVKLDGIGLIATLPATSAPAKGILNTTFKLTSTCVSAEKSPYIFEFTVKDSSCTAIAYDTLRLVVVVKPFPNEAPVLFTENASVKDTTFTLQAGISRTISFRGIDVLGDNVSITSLATPAFLTRNNITFTPRTQRGRVLELSKWEPPCEYKGDTNFVVSFILTDDGCPKLQSDTVTIRFIVLYDPNKAPVSELISVKVSKNGQAYIPNDLQNFAAVPQDSVYIELKGSDVNKDQLQVKGWINDSLTIPNLGVLLTTQNSNNPLLANIIWPINCGLIRNKPYKLSFVFFDNGCTNLYSDTVDFWVTVQDSADRDYTHYNITTPNDDGKNDVFVLPDLPPDNCYNQFISIDIYNRWGVKVFSDTRRSFVWDAKKFAGGTYFYGIRYTHKKYKGWVDVLH